MPAGYSRVASQSIFFDPRTSVGNGKPQQIEGADSALQTTFSDNLQIIQPMETRGESLMLL